LYWKFIALELEDGHRTHVCVKHERNPYIQKNLFIYVQHRLDTRPLSVYLSKCISYVCS